MAERYDFYVHDNRKITFNLTEPIMREDSGVTDFVFHIPKVLNELEVSGWQWWLVFVNAKKEKYSIALTLSDDPERPLEYNLATYTVDYAMSIKAGSVQFALEAINAGTGGAIDNEWHTLTYETKVKETLQGNQAEYAETESDIISALIQEVRTKMNQVIGGATPAPVKYKAQMTDPNAVYLYIGSEPNEHAGHWYYHNGTTFVSGGVYGAGVVDSVPTQGSTNAVSSGGVYEALHNTDTTLTQSGQAADAAAVGDLKRDVNIAPKVLDEVEDNSDLDITDPNGNVLIRLANGHIQTKEFDSSNISPNIEVDDTLTQEGKAADAKATGDAIAVVNLNSPTIGIDNETDSDLDITDTFGNVIVRFSDGHIQTKEFDSADVGDIANDVEQMQEDVSALQSATSGMLYKNQNILEGVYSACRARKTAGKWFSLLIAGDVHGDTERMGNIVEFLNGVSCIDAGIMCGDIVSSMFYHDATFYTDAISNANKPFLTVVGNHDCQWFGEGEEPTYQKIWAKMIDPNIEYADLAPGEYTSGECYYYKDFSDYGIRLIVLYQYDYPYNTIDNDETPYQYGYNSYGQNQIDWLIDTLNDTPSDYGVIIASHSYACRVSKYNDDIFTTNQYASISGQPQTFMDTTNGQIIEDIVHAWATGGAISQTYNYTPTGWGSVTVEGDFTNRGDGEFIAFIGGHWHNSIIAQTYNHGYKVYHVTQASCTQGYGDQSRIPGLCSEDAFVTLSVDRTNKKFNLFQIGAHFCDDTRNRVCSRYSYDANGGN